MKKWPSNLQILITQFGRLPGIGPKMAERIVLYLLKRPVTELQQFSESLKTLTNETIRCDKCFTLTSTNPCEICTDASRDQNTLLVVADPVSAYNIEKSGTFTGTYFILGGLINPIEGLTPEKLRVKQLVSRIKNEPKLQEVIFAFNQNVEGESTLLYLKKLLGESKNLSFSRLARGVPMGADLSYADDITLSSAINDRQKLN